MINALFAVAGTVLVVSVSFAAVDHVPSMSPSYREAICDTAVLRKYIQALEQRIKELETKD